MHPRYPLVAAANRDELHARPTAPLEFWGDAPDVLAGRDLEAGGTWLGVRRGGRFAALTNFRAPGTEVTDARSRGALVSEFLTGNATPMGYVERVRGEGSRYNGFNLVAVDGAEAAWFCNRGGAPAALAPGVHGISNGVLDEPWPKVEEGRAALATALAADSEPDLERLLAILADRTVAPDERLPETGVGIERERLLASRFILDGTYGTRSSTVVCIDERGRALVLERTFDSTGRAVGDRRRTTHGSS